MNKRVNEMHNICQHFSKSLLAMPEGVYEDFIFVRQKVMNKESLTDHDFTNLVMAGSDFGTIIRTAHYHFVARLGFESQSFWDALIKTFVMTVSIFNPYFKEALKDKRMKELLKRTRFPKWGRFGLIGGSRQELDKLAAEFKDYMLSQDS